MGWTPVSWPGDPDPTQRWAGAGGLGPCEGKDASERAGGHVSEDRNPRMKRPHALLLLLLLSWVANLRPGLAEEHPGLAEEHPGLPQFLHRGLEQVRKIRRDGEGLQRRLCTKHSLCHPEELELMRHYLGVRRASVNQCPSGDLELGPCLKQLARGLRLYQAQLEALEGISPQLAPVLDTLQLDVRDFAINIWQQLEDLRLTAGTPLLPPGSVPTFTSTFQRRAGAVLVLDNLQGFLEVVARVLNQLTDS
ncbi:granulocyte colony-stimulating factor [Tachyglossus aculeatus]|uniref:granulocyte colony-stimulating factor n=1 Tax=Tachyglossus aculeatus TaxID=9261 RepID=UPI0018F61737|nr:granulocyte colony-stimulating factor [Tachyglossus aculeatus]